MKTVTFKVLLLLVLLSFGSLGTVRAQNSACRQGTNSAYYYGTIGTHTAVIWSDDKVRGTRCVEWDGDINSFRYEWNLSASGSIGRVARDHNSPGFNPQRVDDCGPMDVQKTTTLTHNGTGIYSNMLYGWLSTDPTSFRSATVEWYVVEDYNTNWAERKEYIGEVTTNGSVYKCYRAYLTRNPGFWQYLAFRVDKRSSGTVRLKTIMDFWRSKGMANDYVIEIGVGEENFNAGRGTWEGRNIVIPACDDPGSAPEEPDPEPEPPTETTRISPSNPNFQYTGRIDFADPDAPKLFYAGSSITTQFSGTSLKARFSEDDWGGSQHVGFIIDGGEMIVREIANGASDLTVDVASGLSEGPHELTIVKRESPGDDNLTFLGLILDEGASLSAPAPRPTRRVELYGNSVTQGVNADNTVDQEGGNEVHNGWNSYGMQLARRLNAECHNQGLSGLAVQDGTGYWNNHTGGIGLVSTYDKTNANARRQTSWDFSRYTPHLVVMALGINDNAFIDASEKESWQESYRGVINALREQYPGADFVLTVPPLGTEFTRIEGYVAEMVSEMNDENVHYFDLTVEVSSAHHPNAAVHTAMADQLETFVNTLAIDWGDNGTPEPEPPAGNGTITVRARGDCGSETMELRVDGERVMTWENVSTSWTDYTFTGFSGSGQVSVHFVNNDNVMGCDRNLAVDYVAVCGTKYETEEVATETATCCTNVPDKLFTNGNFNFGTLSCEASEDEAPTEGNVVIRAKGSAGSETMQLLVDGNQVRQWTNVPTTATDYTYEGYRGGPIEVAFTNDGNDANGRDRNLAIDYLTVCGQKVQAERASRNVSCGNIRDGFVQLWCNSRLNFGDVGCASNTSASTKVSKPKITAQASPEVQVFPNPGLRGVFRVRGLASDREFWVTDLFGQVVLTSVASLAEETLDLSGQPDGVYLLRTSEGKTVKLIKQK